MNTLAYLFIILVALFIGTSDIYQAVDDFNSKKYGWFGLHIMMTAWMIALIFKAVFTY